MRHLKSRGFTILREPRRSDVSSEAGRRGGAPLAACVAGGRGQGGAEVVSVPPASSAVLNREYWTEEGASPGLSEIAAPVPGWGSCSPSCGACSVRRVSD